MVHQEAVIAAVSSPDGKMVLTASRDKTSRLWNAAEGTPIGQPMIHQDSVIATAFSHDARTILTGSEDKTARLWSMLTAPTRSIHDPPGYG